MPVFPYKAEETTTSHGQNPKLRGKCFCPYPNSSNGWYCEDGMLVLWRERTTGTCIPDEDNPRLCRYNAKTKKTTIFTGEPCVETLNGREFDEKWKSYLRRT
jgi:hypothetical protein